jgi:hypothetical protein
MKRAIDWQSKKYRASWFLTWLFTGLLVLPAIASIVFSLIDGKVVSITVLPAELYVVLMSILWATYFGANVISKHSSFTDPIGTANIKAEKDLTDTAQANNSCGQPPEDYNP